MFTSGSMMERLQKLQQIQLVKDAVAVSFTNIQDLYHQRKTETLHNVNYQ